jgi:hypothetical protein
VTGRITFAVSSTTLALATAEDLIRHSAWFQVTPLPDDEFEFETKDESYQRKIAALHGGVASR